MQNAERKIAKGRNNNLKNAKGKNAICKNAKGKNAISNNIISNSCLIFAKYTQNMQS
jgi:hypothetical protein